MDAVSIDVSAPAEPSLKCGQNPAPTSWRALAVACLMALPCLRIPQRILTVGIDDSWGGVLIYAHEKGLQFGRDIAFTYGPLGILSVSGFSPAMAWPRIFFEVVLCYGVAAGFCLLAWRMTLVWRMALLGVFVLVSAPVHWGGDDLLIDFGLLFWGLLCWLESGRRLKFFACGLAAAAAFCALIKFSLLLVAAMTIALLACGIALRGRRRLAAGPIAIFVMTGLSGWMMTGQELAGLGPYLRNSLILASGYNQAMGLENYDWVGGFLVAATAVAGAVIRTSTTPLPDSKHAPLRRGLLLIWLVGMIFLEWKYGFVRADRDHVVCFLAFAPILALVLAALPSTPRPAQLWNCAAALGCVLLAAGLLKSVIPAYLADVCKRTPRQLFQNVDALLRPFDYVRRQTSAYQEMARDNRIEQSSQIIGRATMDVFGQHQMFALFNGFDYQPRPVFQSYAAYNRPLMDLNGQFYTSTKAPEFVLCNLTPIDGRFPPLADAFVLRHLLVNYEFKIQEGDFLLLHRRQNSRPELTQVREGEVQAGERVELGDFGQTNLWMEINMQPTLMGLLRGVLYKPSEVRLGVQSATGGALTNTFPAPASMLAAGFLASPLELDNLEMMNLYQGKPLIRPKAYAVELAPGTVKFWREKIHYRIYRIGNKLGG